jgi:hypothetical protein
VDRGDDDATVGRLSPRRVEGGGMRQSFVVAVSAGDRHSVALTRLGEVYCWGDNRSGQLGMYSNNGDVGGGSSPVSGNRLSRVFVVGRRIRLSAMDIGRLIPQGGRRLTTPTALPGHDFTVKRRSVQPLSSARRGTVVRTAA